MKQAQIKKRNKETVGHTDKKGRTFLEGVTIEMGEGNKERKKGSSENVVFVLVSGLCCGRLHRVISVFVSVALLICLSTSSSQAVKEKNRNTVEIAPCREPLPSMS